MSGDAGVSRWAAAAGRLIGMARERAGALATLRTAGWLIADKVAALAVSIAVGVWVARYLGHEQYGLFTFVIAFAGLFSPLTSLGLDGLVMRDCVRDAQRAPAVLGTAAALRAASALALTGVAAGAMAVMRSGDERLLWYTVLTVGAQVFRAADVIEIWFQSQSYVRGVVLAKSAVLFAGAALRVILVLSRASVEAFIVVIAFEGLIRSAAMLFVYARSGGSVRRWSFDASLVRVWWPVAGPLILGGVAVTIYMKIDQVMLGVMLDNAAVGVYAVAVQISEMCYFVPGAIMSALVPGLMMLHGADRSAFNERMQWIFRVMVVISLMCCVLVLLLSDFVVGLVFGQEYIQAAPILKVHIWAALFVFLGVAQGSWDVIEERTGLAFWRTITGALVNIVLNIVLIPKYGGMGTAIATVIAYGVSAVFMNAVSRYTRPVLRMQIRAVLMLF